MHTGIDRKACNIKFVVFGNTHAKSPFNGVSEILSKSVNNIYMENPAVVIHTGNMIYGGYSWNGIKKLDIHRQFKENLKIMSKISPVLYSVTGEKDLFNGSPLIYREFSKRNVYYSFNYGNLHFIVLFTHEKSGNGIDEKQLNWLKNDMEEYGDSKKILIFTHEPLVLRKKKKYSLKNESLHRLFLKYPVKAVFSGKGSDYYTYKKDGINYTSLGCNGYSKYKRNKTYSHFYIVRYDCKNFYFEKRSIHLNKNGQK
ncbi:metallophosphoesterase family protein [Spirochaetota bacterium]